MPEFAEEDTVECASLFSLVGTFIILILLKDQLYFSIKAVATVFSEESLSDRHCMPLPDLAVLVNHVFFFMWFSFCLYFWFEG